MNIANLWGLPHKANPTSKFNPITPYCTNPNLTLTSLNTALQIANLIMYCGHVRTDRQGGPITRPAFDKATQVKGIGGYSDLPNSSICPSIRLLCYLLTTGPNCTKVGCARPRLVLALSHGPW